MNETWKVLDRTILFDGSPWFQVYVETIILPDGRIIADYYQIVQRDYVEIIAVNEENQILGLWRYKHGPRCINLGLPAGYLEEGETAIAAAKRELREECGLYSDDWSSLGSFVIDGNRGPNRAHVFQANNCRSVEATESDDLEEARQEWLSPSQWKKHFTAGSVATLGVAVAILLGLDKLPQQP